MQCVIPNGAESNRNVIKILFPHAVLALRIRRSFEDFNDHMKANAIGPIIVAQKLMKTGIAIGTMVFMSSDSGSTTEFRAFEDGYGGRQPQCSNV